MRIHKLQSNGRLMPKYRTIQLTFYLEIGCTFDPFISDKISLTLARVIGIVSHPIELSIGAPFLNIEHKRRADRLKVICGVVLLQFHVRHAIVDVIVSDRVSIFQPEYCTDWLTFNLAT